jgi:hypothetical protein
MVYTILGGIFGFIISYVILKCCKVSFQSPMFGPSPGEYGVFCGIVMGMCIGFGYGSSLLLGGIHLFNGILNT